MEYQKIENLGELPELKLLWGIKPEIKSLCYKGEWQPDIFENCVAIVGSRRMTEYGRRVMDKLIPRLVFEQKTVVSGFMYGVDQYAHNLAMDNGGKTIAVLGWGIKEPLATSDWPLAKKIINSGGLLMSEWEERIAARWTFAVRDRILAALSREVFVIEGGVRSGSLITANWATKLGRKLWAVPGPITSKVSEGTNRLIATHQAEAWLGSDSQLEIRDSRIKANNPITRILENEAMTADEVARKLGQPVAEVGAELTILLLQGEVKERGGKYYVEC